MSNPDAPNAVERYTALVSGLLLLLVAVSLLGWSVRLVLAASLTAAGWPPGFGQLLLPVGLTVALTGVGAWRLLRMGLPGRAADRTVLAALAAAAVVGVLM